MTHVLRLFLAAACGAGLLAQDIIYYKFEDGGGTRVINHAEGLPSVPKEGTLEFSSGVTPAQAWGPGRFGVHGLNAGPVSPGAGVQVDTGWNHEVTGDVTIAFHFRTVHPIPSNGGAVIFGSNANMSPGGGIVMAVSGIPGPTFGRLSLSWRPIGSSPSIDLPQDLLTQSFSNWIHVAVVIQPSILQGRWYVNGVAQIPQALTGAWNPIPGTSSYFNVGTRNQCHFRLDEFRVSLRAVPAVEIQQWAGTDVADDAAFGQPCHPLGQWVLLGSQGGRPALGNSGYGLVVYGPAGGQGLLAIGTNRLAFQGMPLPLALAPFIAGLDGCFLLTSAEQLLPVGIGVTGAAAIPAPIPPVPSLAGAAFYTQAIVLHPGTGAWLVTNGFVTSLGS